MWEQSTVWPPQSLSIHTGPGFGATSPPMQLPRRPPQGPTALHARWHISEQH